MGTKEQTTKNTISPLSQVRFLTVNNANTPENENKGIYIEIDAQRVPWPLKKLTLEGISGGKK